MRSIGFESSGLLGHVVAQKSFLPGPVVRSLVVACVLKGESGQQPVSETKSFGTRTSELMEMVEWLKGHGVTHAAMEATGNFWMQVYNLLEGHFELIVTNAAHM
ncbi:MAG: hypothetical protein WCD63_13300 [Terrimicrobiaceae bacterium]